jgi:thiamine biosynthesis protein ThiS
VALSYEGLYYVEKGECMVLLSGKENDRVAGLNISDMLEKENYESKYVVVEINGVIIERDKFATQVINDGDVVEVVQFMGGGI